MKTLFYFPMIFILVFLCDFPAEAQYKIVNFTDMNQINSLTEDGDYIWVSTSGGAFKRKKSDGSLVKVVNTDNSGISRNAVNTMFIDFFNNYWFGTKNGGICKFDGNSWTTFKKADNINIYSCEAITSDLNGNLWFGVNGGVLKYNNDTWKFINFGPYRSVSSIVADDIGNIWASIAGINGAGLWKIDTDEKVEKIPGPGSYFDLTSAPYCMRKDNNNNIWIGAWGGLFKYNNNTGEWTDYRPSLPATVHSMTQDNIGNIWFGTESGVVKYNGSVFSPAVGSGRTGFNENLVMDILSDSQGKVWIGSYKGLAQLNQETNAWTTPILLNCLPSNYAETVVFDSYNKAWVYGQFENTLTFDGSFWGSVNNNSGDNFWWMKKAAIDDANNKYVALPGSDTKLHLYKLNANNNTSSYIISTNLTYSYAHEVVQDLKYDETYGKIWIATNQGLFWFKISNNTYGKYTKTAGGLTSNSLKGLAINGSKVWYSTTDMGIGYFDQADNIWKAYSTADGLPSVSSGEMAFDVDNNLWIISSNLVKYDGILFSTISFPGGLYPNHIACDLTGNIWLGGYNGVVKYKDGKFRLYTTEDGLIENTTSNIVVDPLNNIWVPTGYYGLTKLVPQVPVAEFSSNTACLPGSTILTNLSVKTDDLTTYEWDINNDGTIEYTTRDAELIFPVKGIYDVKLKVANDDLFSEIVHQVNVLEAPDVSLNLEGEYNLCLGGSQYLQVIINNPDPDLVYRVDWNNGINGTQQIWASEAGEYYAVVNNGECETQSPSLNLQITEPYAEEKICMVTVDTETGKNMIIWKRTHDVGISSYNVYKLFGNSYVPIGNVSSGETSQYVDYTSTPEALAARYAISSIDFCGNESPKSTYHQTIQLGASIGSDKQSIVLDWTNYIDESKIWQPEWYFIYRGNDPSNLELIDSIATAFTEWNDMNPGDNRYYQVLIKKSMPCDPAELLGKKASSGPYLHSLSNLEDNRLQSTGINDFNSSNSLRIFPNPMKTESRIKWENPDSEKFDLVIFDLKGTVVRTENGLNTEEYILKRESLSPGCYIVELKGSNTYHERLLVD